MHYFLTIPLALLLQLLTFLAISLLNWGGNCTSYRITSPAQYFSSLGSISLLNCGLFYVLTFPAISLLNCGLFYVLTFPAISLLNCGVIVLLIALLPNLSIAITSHYFLTFPSHYFLTFPA